MEMKEIVAIEAKNKSDIHLHKDGLFWRAYNVSAYQFAKYFRPFKVNKKMVKHLKEEIAFLGFPEKTLLEITKEAEQQQYELRKSETHIQIIGLPTIMGNDYSDWLKKLPLNEKLGNARKKESNSDLLDQIRSFPLLEKSPLETQLFLLKIQKTINGLT